MKKKMTFTLGDMTPEKFRKIGTTNKNRRNKARRKARKKEWKEQHSETVTDVIKNLSESRKRNKK